jgi:hypothetical protein
MKPPAARSIPTLVSSRLGSSTSIHILAGGNWTPLFVSTRATGGRPRKAVKQQLEQPHAAACCVETFDAPRPITALLGACCRCRWICTCHMNLISFETSRYRLADHISRQARDLHRHAGPIDCIYELLSRRPSISGGSRRAGCLPRPRRGLAGAGAVERPRWLAAPGGRCRGCARPGVLLVAAAA